MTVFAISAPLEREDELAAAAARHGHRVAVRAATADETIARLDHVQVDAVLVDARERHLNKALVRACDERGLRLLAVVDDPSDAARARSLGVDSVRFGDGFGAIEWSVVSPHTHETTPARGTVITVWGPHGAPGRTTVAIALASELAAKGASVALADVDTHSAAIAQALSMLDESPGFAAAARLVRSGSLTVDELDRVSQLHSTAFGAFRVLTGIARASRWPELGGDRVAGVLDACRDWVDFTVVDVAASLESDEEVSSDMFSPRRNAATLAALREADHVIAVGGGDPVSLTRLLHGYPELIEIVPPERVTVVMNKVRASAAGLAPETSLDQSLRRFAGIECQHFWPFDAGAADGAMLAGKTLQDVAGRSTLRRRIESFATTLLPQQPETRRERRQRTPRRGLLPTRSRAREA